MRGYPAGLPRLTTLDLTGKLTGPSCVLRLRTNMECYWDQAFVAVADAKAEAMLVADDAPRCPRGAGTSRLFARGLAGRPSSVTL